MGKFHQQQHKKNAPVQNRPLGKAFVVPDRKLMATNAAAAKPAQAKPVNNNDRAEHNKNHQQPTKAKNFPPARRSWWESVPTLEEKDLIKFEEGQHWHSKLPAFLDTANTNPSFELNGDRLTAACKTIDNAYHQQLKLYGEWLKNSTEMKGDLKWMNDMIKSGTMSDKVAAMALKVQSSPFHELDTLDALMAMALRKEQRGAQLSMEALKDLFVNNLLAPRAMRSMDANALNHPEMMLSTALLVWYEAQIKTRYERLLEALETGLKSNVDYFKRECLQTVSELLIGKPEQESRLLAMLVNKLGDPSRATCSKAIEVLKQVMRAHPAMKIVIVREVRQFLYRPNLKIRPVFNGIILLAQVQLTSKADHAVAVQLVEGYLSLFEKTMKEEEYGSRLLSALLTGINKALPYLQNTDSLDKYVDPLFKIVHTATSFSTATQAMMLLSHLALSSSNSAAANNAAAEQAQDGKTAPQESPIIKRYYRALYAKLLSEQITTRSRNTLFLNLLYRSIKGDKMQHRALAFIKRLLICAVQSVPPIAAGLLFLISEILKARPALKTMLADVPEIPSAQGRSQNPSDKTDADGEVGFLGNFNVAKREPEFGYAPDAMPNVWEMSLLERHYHPSVQNFTTSLMSAPEHGINFGGDPTVEFSLMAFLNRFAYKNPKKNAADNKTKHRTASQAKEEPVNIAMTAQEASADNVEPDKQFFFKYFSDKSKLVAAGRSRNKSKHQAEEDGSGSDDDDSDADDAGSDAGDRANEVESDADEAEIDRYADKLAEDLLRSAGNNIDDFDFSDEDDSDDGSAVAGAEEGEDALGEDSDGEEGLDFDQGLEGSDDEDSDSEEEAPRGKGGKSKSAKKSAGKKSASSKALDFADFVAEQQQKGAKKGSKSKAPVEDDSSDDGYTGLVAYGDEDNEQPLDEEMDEEESLLGDGSSEDEQDASDDDDQDSEDASEDGSEAGDDSADDFDSAEEEALENAGFGDSDEEVSGKKGKRGGNGKKRSAMDTFASAEDYEDLMDDIVRKVSKPAPAVPVAAIPAVPAAAPAGKGGKKPTPAAAPVSTKQTAAAAPAVAASAAKAGGEQKKRKDVPAQAAPSQQASGKGSAAKAGQPAAGAKKARK